MPERYAWSIMHGFWSAQKVNVNMTALSDETKGLYGDHHVGEGQKVQGRKKMVH